MRISVLVKDRKQEILLNDGNSLLLKTPNKSKQHKVANVGS